MTILKLLSLLLCLCVPMVCYVHGGASDGGRFERIPASPVNQPSHAQMAADVAQMVANAQDSGARMLESAGDAHADQAREVWEKYASRLEELAGMDYDAMSDEALGECMLELSEIISAFREVRDRINGLE